MHARGFEEYEAGLLDIDRCTDLYVLYWQNRSDRSILQTRTPWGLEIRGVVSTRSPNRPNPIGLCVVNPEGFVTNQFCSSRTSLTKTERLVLGGLFRTYPPDMIIDYHSLGPESGSKHDIGDMEVILPANTTKWAMDEQIHLHVAQRMVDAAEEAGWPYEIHTLEDLATYYFGEKEVGNMPWSPLKEKMFLLHMQDSHDDYDIPEEAALNTLTPQAVQSTYTNYTCGPAYMKWHSLVFGMETNHGALCSPFENGQQQVSLGKGGWVSCQPPAR